MTKPKTKLCLSCQANNTSNLKTCSGCLCSLESKQKLKKKQAELKNSNWAASVKKNRNASRILNSAQLSVSKLHVLDYKPILFLCHHDRKGQFVGDIIHHVEPTEGVVQEILMNMRKLYEHLLRKLLSPPSRSAAGGKGTPAAGPVPVVAKNEEYAPVSVVAKNEEYAPVSVMEENEEYAPVSVMEENREHGPVSVMEENGEHGPVTMMEENEGYAPVSVVDENETGEYIVHKEYILHIEPVPQSSLPQSPSSSSASLLPPGISSVSLPPLSSSQPPPRIPVSPPPPSNSSTPRCTSIQQPPSSPPGSDATTQPKPKKWKVKECSQLCTRKPFLYESVVDGKVLM
ncbi:hypothetical protein GBF38_015539 [Nibea albiflora]|uniref:Uncharacterized protein n=1 Tax=Nibea albiflora TaxID=240163 RepID=A0ACB7EM82_NIBAL|nr:hypothetical protein GBF38_015539 [Nibea albiflora]